MFAQQHRVYCRHHAEVVLKTLQRRVLLCQFSQRHRTTLTQTTTAFDVGIMCHSQWSRMSLSRCIACTRGVLAMLPEAPNAPHTLTTAHPAKQPSTIVGIDCREGHRRCVPHLRHSSRRLLLHAACAQADAARRRCTPPPSPRHWDRVGAFSSAWYTRPQ